MAKQRTASSEFPTRVSEPLISYEFVLPGDTNHYGGLYGGRLLESMIKQAFLAGTRYCRKVVLAAACERMDFIAPVHQGEILETSSKVLYTQDGWLVVQVIAQSEHPTKVDKRLATKGFFIMAAREEDRTAAAIPQVACLSAHERRASEEARTILASFLERRSTAPAKRPK